MKEFKEGQKVWSSRDGEVIIKAKDYRSSVRYPLEVDGLSYSMDGKFNISDEHPTLFHSKEDMIEYFQNVKTKRTYTKWFNVYANGSLGGCYDSREQANKHIYSTSERIDCIPFTYEVEE